MNKAVRHPAHKFYLLDCFVISSLAMTKEPESLSLRASASDARQSSSFYAARRAQNLNFALWYFNFEKTGQMPRLLFFHNLGCDISVFGPYFFATAGVLGVFFAV